MSSLKEKYEVIKREVRASKDAYDIMAAQIADIVEGSEGDSMAGTPNGKSIVRASQAAMAKWSALKQELVIMANLVDAERSMDNARNLAERYHFRHPELIADNNKRTSHG